MFKHKLNTPENPILEFQIESGKYEGYSFKAKDISPCMEPTCDCGNIYFSDGLDAKTRKVYTLDVNSNRVSDYSNEKNPHTDFAKALENEIKEDDWTQLYEFFFNLKSSLCEFIEPKDVNYEFSKQGIKDIKEGFVVGNSSILPWSLTFPMNIEGVEYDVEDFYCLNPTCNCKDVVFFVRKDEADKFCMSFLHNYKTKTWEIEEIYDNTIDSNQILEAFKEKRTDLIAQVAPLRHEKLRQILKNDLAKKLEEEPISNPTIGRNDLCFCGSGKKYKKCHGA